MKISTFFRQTLGANLSNSRWSWGAYQPNSNRLFLRVWDDGIETVGGIERVPVYWDEWKSKSAGFPERKRHVELLGNGTEGYGVVCTAVDADPNGNRTIAKFDEATLLKLGKLIKDGTRLYAAIIGRIPVAQLRDRQTGYSTLVPDLQSIASKKPTVTTKETLANARVGQGIFRSEVLAHWNGKCAVTGSTTLDAIRASHIKPWRDSTDAERLDYHNGIPLTATLDALFDAGLISFDKNGTVLISDALDDAERQTLHVTNQKMLRTPSDEAAGYLEYHRENIFTESK
ncbi:HNH endonuclease [Adhaeretor mobilis]|uniref:HNH nuclease domain-containing protein n=1 Tax=Adhaeretor mobilis TaxID=1930276 RepID=A0A517N2V6_9BACT|nr:HNH endonuclease [Adhaeretor mobilis]QDT01471.1 hypothetical protein HG15A2_48130 [Adhaeretor mobilis]